MNTRNWVEVGLLFLSGALLAVILDLLGVETVRIAIITFGIGVLFGLTKRWWSP